MHATTLLTTLALSALTTALPSPQITAATDDAASAASCLGPNLLFNTGFEDQWFTEEPYGWQIDEINPPPPIMRPPGPHVPHPVVQVALNQAGCGTGNSYCFYIFWGLYPGTAAGSLAISQGGTLPTNASAFIGEKGKTYELSVDYRLNSYNASGATLSCWASTQGVVTPPTQDSILLHVDLSKAKLGEYHHKKGSFPGWKSGLPVADVGCTLDFGPGGFNSTLDIDNIEVHEKRCDS
jgi:hypothetical protein